MVVISTEIETQESRPRLRVDALWSAEEPAWPVVFTNQWMHHSPVYMKRCITKRDLGQPWQANRLFRSGLFPIRFADLIQFSFSRKQLYFFTNWSRWAKEVDLEYQNRSGEQKWYMFGWLHVDLLVFPSAVCTKYYVKISPKWEDDLDSSHKIVFTASPAFSECSYVALADENSASAP